MSLINSVEFVEGVFTRLNASAALTAIVGASIFSHVPQDDALPFAVVSLNLGADFGSKSQYGFAAELIVDTWSNNHDIAETLQMQDAIIAALHNQAITVTGAKNICLQKLSVDMFQDPDGQSFHGVTRFRALLLTDAPSGIPTA